MTLIIVCLFVFWAIRYRARGENQQRILGRGLRWGFTIGIVGYALVSLFFFVAPPSGPPEGTSGLAPLYGLVVAGPLWFKIGFTLGFLLGAGREWWRQWAI